MRLLMSAAALLLMTSAALADCAHPETITAADSSGTALSGVVYCYQVAAQAGQQLTLSVTSASKDVLLTVLAPGWQTNCNSDGDCDLDGEQLSDDNATSWSDAAPMTGNYLVVIDNLHSDADYELGVDIR